MTKKECGDVFEKLSRILKKLKSVEIGQKWTELEPCQVADELREEKK